MRDIQEKSKTLLCCYAREDQAMLRDLKNHLTALEKEGLISLWDDTNINPGTPWEREITHQLHAAQIILLLVSSDFIASEYCYGKEMKQAIERHNNDTARVIPVILRPVDWQKTPLGLLQALPKDGKPVRQWRDLDEAYVNITEGVRAIAENWLPQSTSGSLSEENIFAYDTFLTKEERFQLQRIQAEYANTLDETADDPDALYEKGLTYYAQNRPKEAILLWRQGHTQYPDYGNGIFVGNLKEHLQKLRPQQIQELHQQADNVYREGMLDEQITYLQMILKIQPDEPAAVVKLTTAMKNKRYIWMFEKVRQFIHDGNIQLAQSLLADLIQQAPQFPNIAMLTELLQKKIAEQKAEKIKLFIDQDIYANAIQLLTDMKSAPSNHSELLTPSLEGYLYRHARQKVEQLIATGKLSLASEQLNNLKEQIPQFPDFSRLEVQINREIGQQKFTELQQLLQQGNISFATRQKLEDLRKITPPHPNFAYLERELHTQMCQKIQQSILKGEIDKARSQIKILKELAPQHPRLTELELQLHQYIYDYTHHIIEPLIAAGQLSLARKELKAIQQSIPQCPNFMHIELQINLEEGKLLFAKLQRLPQPTDTTSHAIWQRLEEFCKQTPPQPKFAELERQLHIWLIQQTQQALLKGETDNTRWLINKLRKLAPQHRELEKLELQLAKHLYRQKILDIENIINNGDIDTLISTTRELELLPPGKESSLDWSFDPFDFFDSFDPLITQPLVHLALENQLQKRLVLEIQQETQHGDSSSAKSLLSILRERAPEAKEISILTNNLCTQLYKEARKNFRKQPSQEIRKQPFRETENQLEEIWRFNPAFPDSAKLLEKMELCKSNKGEAIMLAMFCLTAGLDASVSLLTQSWFWIIGFAIVTSLVAYKFNISVYKKRALSSSIVIASVISLAITFFLTGYFFQIDYHHPQYANVWPFQGHEIWLQKQVIFGIVLGIILPLIIPYIKSAISTITFAIILILAFIAPLLNWGFGFGSGWYLILLGLLCSSIGTAGILMCIETPDTAKKSTKQLFLEQHGLAPTRQTRT